MKIIKKALVLIAIFVITNISFASPTLADHQYIQYVTVASDIVTIGCSEETSRIQSPFGEATATCVDATTPAPEGFAYFRNTNTKLTNIDGHHDNVDCILSYQDEFNIPVQTPGGSTIIVAGYKQVRVDGRAKAKGAGRTARITCDAQAIRSRY